MTLESIVRLCEGIGDVQDEVCGMMMMMMMIHDGQCRLHQRLSSDFLMPSQRFVDYPLEF